MIEEERENIINNENTAQERFERIVETLTKPVKKIIIPEPLSGDIDLSSLKELGVGIPDEIIFQKGKITNAYCFIEQKDGKQTYTIYLRDY